MDVYIVSVTNDTVHPLVRDIMYMMDGVAGMRVHTHLPVHLGDRETVDDYQTQIAFAHRPTCDKVYKLGDLPVYIDDRYTTVYFGHPLELYVVINRDCTSNAWNILRHLLPSPTQIYNGKVVEIPSGSAMRYNTLWVDTLAKPALFDNRDVLLDY